MDESHALGAWVRPNLVPFGDQVCALVIGFRPGQLCQGSTMLLSEEQHTRIAIAYEKAAAIKELPASEREHFANQASRFRWLAKRAAEKAAEKVARGEARKTQYDLARRWAAWRLQTG